MLMGAFSINHTYNFKNMLTLQELFKDIRQ